MVALAPDEFLSTEQAASYLGLSSATLESWRSRPTNNMPPIPFVRIGSRRVRYRLSSLKEWLSRREFCSTREEKHGH